MPAWSIATRLIYLMSYVGWENFEKWQETTSEVVQSHLPAFLAWFHSQLPFIKEARVQEALYAYYVNGESRPVASGYNQSIERGKVALAALYNYQQNRPAVWSRPEIEHEEVS